MFIGKHVAGNDLNNIILTAADYNAGSGRMLKISDRDTSTEAKLTVKVDISK